MKKIIVGMSGASGVIYGIRTLMHLRAMDGVETHLVLSKGALTNIRIETDYEVAAVNHDLFLRWEGKWPTLKLKAMEEAMP